VELNDIYTGTSLHFDAALPKGSGEVETEEHSQSHSVSGSIVATPANDWAIIQKVLPQVTRPAPGAAKAFAVAYVPYIDGRIHYHEGTAAVLSDKYSGCLMAVYSDANKQRRVAHVPKSNNVDNDCIGEFRDYFDAHSTLAGAEKTKHVKTGHKLKHYFQPFVESRDADIQLGIIGKLIQEKMISEVYGFSVFGLVTARDDSCVSIWAVKPAKQPATGEMWHVLLVRKRQPLEDFKALVGKKNRAVKL